MLIHLCFLVNQQVPLLLPEVNLKHKSDSEDLVINITENRARSQRNQSWCKTSESMVMSQSQVKVELFLSTMSRSQPRRNLSFLIRLVEKQNARIHPLDEYRRLNNGATQWVGNVQQRNLRLQTYCNINIATPVFLGWYLLGILFLVLYFLLSQSDTH